MKAICPGQDTRFWKPDDIFELPCGKCGATVEFFRDDVFRRCRRCGHRIENPKMTLGCAQWCEHAQECLGYDPKEFAELYDGEDSFLGRLVEAVKERFGPDRESLTHALAVLEYAEDLVRSEKANPKVVLAAAALHTLAGDQARCSDAGETPGPAREVLDELGVHWEAAGRVCRLLGGLAAGGEDTPELSVVRDAEALADLEDRAGRGDAVDLASQSFRLELSKDLAQRILARRAHP